MVEGDLYYIFSDGYVSQFNGVSGKKYMTARFKQFLLKICTLPMEEQKLLLIEEYETWRGNAAQLDDLLVIGIRIAPQGMDPLNGAAKEADVATADVKN
jgi:serine phosphatase RsbU (regulator of sigma subunit)